MLREQRNDIIHTLYDTDNNSFMKLTYECECCSELIDNYPDSIYLESGNSESAFKKVINRIRELLKKLGEKISELFNNKKVENIKKTVKENPELAKEKIEMVDYEKLSKNADDALKEIDRAKSLEDIQATKEKYEKRKKTIMKGAAVVTVIGGLAIVNKIKGDRERRQQMVDDIYKNGADSTKWREVTENSELLSEKKLQAKLSVINDVTREAIGGVSYFDTNIKKRVKLLKNVSGFIQKSTDEKKRMISNNTKISDANKEIMINGEDIISELSNRALKIPH